MRWSHFLVESKSRQTLLAATLLVISSASLHLVTVGDAVASESEFIPAPEFKLAALSGDLALQDYRGHYLYVDFWASWCGPCRQSFPWMNDMLNKYDAQGLKIIAINLDEQRDDASRFLEEIRADIDIAFDPDGATAEAFRVRGMPSSYLINPEGEIVFSHIGFRKRDTAQLEAEIARLMGVS